MGRGLHQKDGAQGHMGRIEIDVSDMVVEIDIYSTNGDGQIELSSSILERNNMVRRQGELHQLPVSEAPENQVHVSSQEAPQQHMHHLPAKKDIDIDRLSQSQATEKSLGTADLAVEIKNRKEFLSTCENGLEKEHTMSSKHEIGKCQLIATHGKLFSGLPVQFAQHEATAVVAAVTTTAAGMVKKDRDKGCASMEVSGTHQDKHLRCPSLVRARSLKQPGAQNYSSNVTYRKDTWRGSGGTEGAGISGTPGVLPTQIPSVIGESVGATGKQASRSSGGKNGAGMSAPPGLLPATVECVTGEAATEIGKETLRSSGRTKVSGLLASPLVSPPTVAFVAGEPVWATGKDSKRSKEGKKGAEPSGSPGFLPATILSVSSDVQTHESEEFYLGQSPPSGQYLSQKTVEELEVHIKRLKKEHDGLRQRMVSIESEMARLQCVQKREIERLRIQSHRAAKSCLQLKSRTSMQLSPPLRRNIAVQGSLQQAKATACTILRPLIDGYNWRKYNEVIPPGTSSPQVFYGCTNMGCIARKIEEHSPTGHVRHIYEGSHNHLLSRKAMALIRSCKKRKLSYGELEKGRLQVDG